MSQVKGFIIPSCTSCCFRYARHPLKLEVIFCVQAVITAPCGVPLSPRPTIRHLPDTPAFSHFWIRRSTRGIGDPVLDELHQPLVTDVIEGNHHTLPIISTSRNA